MSPRTRYLLRLTSRSLRLVLPVETHRRLSITAKSALIGYREARLRMSGDGQLQGSEVEPIPSSASSFLIESIQPASKPLPGTSRGAAELAQGKVSRFLVEEAFEPSAFQPLLPAGGGVVEGEPAVDRDAIAYPVAPFVGCDGTHVQPGLYLEGRLSTIREKCKLVLCCAFSGRHRIVERIVRESIAANHGAEVRWMLVGSSPGDLALIEALSKQTRRVAGFVVENRPLGRKWQSCLYFATQYYDAELFGITGSDDFVSSRLIDYVIDRHEKNSKHTSERAFLPAMYGTLEWLVCNTNPRSRAVPQILKCSYGYETAFEPLGAGRFYTSRFLDECGGLIFESDKERLLDDRGYFELRDRGYPLEYYTLEDGPLVSVKGDWEQLNKIEDFLAATTLRVEEFSFEGRNLLKKVLSDGTLKFLFKPTPIAPQLSFAALSTGLKPAPSPERKNPVPENDEAATAPGKREPEPAGEAAPPAP